LDRSSNGAAVDVDSVEVVFRTRTESVHALGPETFHITPGEFVSVVGPSGCGKSTLLRCVSGLIPPTRGQVRIDDQVIKSPIHRVGIVFQKPLLLDWRTVRENVLLQASIRKQNEAALGVRADELLEIAGLSQFANSAPYELSGGMQQRVAICRALVHTPPLLLMDEPFGALDALTREQMSYDLQDLWQRTRPSVLFITHSITEAIQLSDRIVVMSARPGVTLEEIRVPFDRPRHEKLLSSDPRAIEIAQRIRGLLGVE